MKKIRRVRMIFGILMILTGAGIFSYPFVSNYLSNKNATVAVEEYREQVEQMDKNEIDAIKEAAAARNAMLSDVDADVKKDEKVDPDTYKDLINIGAALGYITIPCIDLNLPIYEGTGDTVLEKGVGHITETSYPLGGKDTHAVLSAHRGLAEAELFTNLDKVKRGNQFYLHILDEVLAYEVDQVKVVEPDDISDLQTIEGEDLCSLVTCTPLGINSHRLIVRGHRVPYNGEDDDAKSIYQSVHTGTAMARLVRIWPWLALTAIVLMGTEMLFCMMIVKRMKRRMEED